MGVTQKIRKKGVARFRKMFGAQLAKLQQEEGNAAEAYVKVLNSGQKVIVIPSKKGGMRGGNPLGLLMGLIKALETGSNHPQFEAAANLMSLGKQEGVITVTIANNPPSIKKTSFSVTKRWAINVEKLLKKDAPSLKLSEQEAHQIFNVTVANRTANLDYQALKNALKNLDERKIVRRYKSLQEE